MEKQYFIQLLHKYLKGESTSEEDELIISYYNLFENEQDVLALLNQEKKEEIKNEIYIAIQINISQRENQPARVRSIAGWVIRSAAAAAAVLVIASLSVHYILNHKTIQQQNVTAQANDKKQNRVFHLPDGSMVILNYGSKLNYAPGFDHSVKREVYLEGQAFFDIRHDPSRPFIVHTDNVMTTVLGTAFNVKAVKGEKHITVTVSRGKVKVSDQNKTLDLLTPDQQIIYDKTKGNAVKNMVNARDFLQWKDQEDLAIDNVTFEETAKLLEDKFKLTISFKDPILKNSRFTTVLLKSENLEQIIKTICDFNGAVWEYNKEKTAILISKKK
jgi:ferric-dicitrate binding protein FerR (iron transport regulator)